MDVAAVLDPPLIEQVYLEDSSKIKDLHWYRLSYKKQKVSLETRVALLIFSLELEIPGLAVQQIHQNCEKQSKDFWEIA